MGIRFPSGHGILKVEEVAVYTLYRRYRRPQTFGHGLVGIDKGGERIEANS
jgi:hypothetical protein